MFDQIFLSPQVKRWAVNTHKHGICKFPQELPNDLTMINIQHEGGQKGPPYKFCPVASTNVGISPQNSLTFSFNPFATLV